MQLVSIISQHPVESLIAVYSLINLVIALRSAPTSRERCTIVVQYLEAFFSRISFMTYRDHKNSVKLPGAAQPGYPSIAEMQEILNKVAPNHLLIPTIPDESASGSV